MQVVEPACCLCMQVVEPACCLCMRVVEPACCRPYCEMQVVEPACCLCEMQVVEPACCLCIPSSAGAGVCSIVPNSHWHAGMPRNRTVERCRALRQPVHDNVVDEEEEIQRLRLESNDRKRGRLSSGNRKNPDIRPDIEDHVRVPRAEQRTHAVIIV